MRQAEGQAEPDPPTAGFPPPPRRRGWRRWWLVLLLVPLPPLTAGVFGWFAPSESWWGVWVLPAGTAMHIAQRWEDGKIPERHRRPRWVALEIGYAALCGIVGPVGAWLAR
jgi:hypothetical protein